MRYSLVRCLLCLGAGILVVAYASIVYVDWYFQPLRNALPLAAHRTGAIYLKREAIGWDIDRMAIAANPDPCVPIMSNHDYVFHSADPSQGLTYRIDGPDLIVYTDAITPSTPTNASSIGRNIVRESRSDVLYLLHDQAFVEHGYRHVIVSLAGQRCSSYLGRFTRLPFEMLSIFQE